MLGHTLTPASPIPSPRLCWLWDSCPARDLFPPGDCPLWLRVCRPRTAGPGTVRGVGGRRESGPTRPEGPGADVWQRCDHCSSQDLQGCPPSSKEDPHLPNSGSALLSHPAGWAESCPIKRVACLRPPTAYWLMDSSLWGLPGSWFHHPAFHS